MFDADNQLISATIKKGNLIIDLDPGFIDSWLKKLLARLFNNLEQLFLFFDRTLIKMAGFLSLAGIGLGLGAAITVFGQPDIIQAGSQYQPSPEQASVTGIIAPSQNTLLSFTDGGIRELQLTPKSNSSFIWIADLSLSNKMSWIKNINLGEEVELIKNNNGVYRYRVIEVKYVESKDVLAAINPSEPLLVMQTPDNFLRTRLALVIAKPLSFASQPAQ